MKKHLGRYILIMAIVMSLFAVQNAFAETVVQTITGMIESISTHPNTITIDDADIYGIRINHLAKYGIDIYEIQADQSEVSILAYEYLCSDGSTKLMASEFSVGDVTVTLRPVP